MTDEKQIVEIPPADTALQVYSAEKGLDPFLSKIREEIDGFIPDVTSRKGRDAIASIAHKVARSKTALDNVGKELVAELKDIPKKIDAERKRMRDLLDAWKDEVRAPLTAWEEAETARVAAHQAGIESLRNTNTDGASAAMIRALIDDMESEEIGADWEEFEAEAHRVKAASLASLRDALAKREQYEAEQAELERLRAEAAERAAQDERDRIAREAAERATCEAEQRAQADRDAAERRELELKLEAEASARREAEAKQRAEQAERDAIEQKAAAERQAAQDKLDADRRQAEAVARAEEAERQRQADEAARIEAEAKAREADRAHKGAVLKAAKEAVMLAGITEDQAREVVKLIAAGKVPNVSIAY